MRVKANQEYDMIGNDVAHVEISDHTGMLASAWFRNSDSPESIASKLRMLATEADLYAQRQYVADSQEAK